MKTILLLVAICGLTPAQISNVQLNTPGSVYCVTLNDGEVLWEPESQSNPDLAAIQGWASVNGNSITPFPTPAPVNSAINALPGQVMLSVAPANASLPVAVGTNDPRMVGLPGLPLSAPVTTPTTGSIPVVFYAGYLSSPISNTASETLFSLYKSVPAGTVTAGSWYQITARGFLSTAVLGATLNLAVRYGNQDIVSTGPVSLGLSLASKSWSLVADVYFPTAGANGTASGDIFTSVFSALGTAAIGTGTSAGTISLNTGSASPNNFGVAATWGVSNAANIITCQPLIITRVQ